jgi:hypothetical protein
MTDNGIGLIIGHDETRAQAERPQLDQLYLKERASNFGRFSLSAR